MKHMFVFYNHPEMRHLLATTTCFTETVDEFDRLLIDKDLRLALNDYRNDIPTALKVELYRKEGDNYILESTWVPDRTRDEAIIEFYKNANVTVQKDFFNSKVVDL